MRSETARVNDPFRYALVIEVKKLLAKMKILERGRAASADLQGVLVVGNRNVLLRGQHGVIPAGDLMHFSTGADRDALVGVLRGRAVFDGGSFRIIGLTFFGM